MAFAYFISQDYLKKYTPIDDNVDQRILNPVIRSCQEDYIKPVLGTDLYEKLISDINASTVSGTYKTLLDDYIRPALREWVMYEAPLAITIKMRNNGALKQSNEGGSPVSLQEMNKVEDRYRQKAQMKMELLDHYLCAESDNLPEYLDNSDDTDRNPIGISFSTGIYLGLKSNKSRNKYP